MKMGRIQLALCVVAMLAANGAIGWLARSDVATARAKAGESVIAAPVAEGNLAAIPTAFSYQGTLRLADGSLATGNFNITIKIYNSVTGGNVLHSESFANTVARNGSFSVIVGDTTPINPALFDNANLYLGITVAPDPEMLPRQRLLPVPWAMQAASAQNAQTANTLMANATIPGQLTIDRGNGGASNGQWPALLLTSNGDGYGSALYLRNINGNQNWSIHPDPAGELHIEDRNNGAVQVVINQNGTVTVHNLGVGGNMNTNGTISAGGNINAGGDINASNLTLVGNLLVGGINGNVNANGKVTANKGFNGKCGADPGAVGLLITCNQDVAETFATDQRTEPGDLVVFVPDDRANPTVRRSGNPYETTIVGVVSTNPGLVFDQGKTYLAGDNANLITDEKTVVAMVGRVPTKFSLENGPIAVGDPLTSSSTPGVAMKATQAGQIIGYAMQSSAAAEDGKLLVWLQIGTYVPPATLAALNDLTAAQLPAAATNAAAADQTIAELQAQIATLAAQVDQLSDQLAEHQAVGR